MSVNLGLGTVQFGCDYGISNSSGKPLLSEIKKILSVAGKNDIKIIDTAALYGDSERNLGECDLSSFSIVTKTPRFGADIITDMHVSGFNNTFSQSLKNLRQSSIYGLLFHHAPDLLAKKAGLLWQAALDLKRKGQIEKIGVSIYDGQQLDQLMEMYDLDLVQIPLNVLDQRLLQSGHIDRLKAKGIEIHVRSVFLQGLLLMESPPDYFNEIKPLLDKWKQRASQHSMSLTEAAFQFVKSIPGVDVILTGTISENQLIESIRSFNDSHTFNAEGLACNMPHFIDPSLWQLTLNN